jgi:hypothetical protein
MPSKPLRVACTVTFSPDQARRIEEMLTSLNQTRPAGHGPFRNAGDVIFSGLIALDLILSGCEQDSDFKSLFEKKL